MIVCDYVSYPCQSPYTSSAVTCADYHVLNSGMRKPEYSQKIRVRPTPLSQGATNQDRGANNCGKAPETGCSGVSMTAYANGNQYFSGFFATIHPNAEVPHLNAPDLDVHIHQPAALLAYAAVAAMTTRDAVCAWNAGGWPKTHAAQRQSSQQTPALQVDGHTDPR